MTTLLRRAATLVDHVVAWIVRLSLVTLVVLFGAWLIARMVGY